MTDYSFPKVYRASLSHVCVVDDDVVLCGAGDAVVVLEEGEAPPGDHDVLHEGLGQLPDVAPHVLHLGPHHRVHDLRSPA